MKKIINPRKGVFFSDFVCRPFFIFLHEEAIVTFRRDSIQGFTIGTIYSLLNGNTTSAASLINQLRTYIPSNFLGNNQPNYDTLRTRYGY